MWYEIDELADDYIIFRTYASQVGSIGCLVMVIGVLDSPTSAFVPTFVPGVKLERKEGKFCLVSQDGFGGPPPSFESQ